MRSLAQEAHHARHMAVVDEAIVEFNRDGVAGASLASIAKRVGLTRAGLYRYCPDRQSLVHQCYARTCESVQSSLRHAYLFPASGIDRVAAFLRMSLESHEKPTAILSEVAYLTSEQQASIRKAWGENVALLGKLLSEGQKDKSVRTCHVEIASHAILGVLSWAPMAQIWTRRSDPVLGQRIVQALPAMVLDGIIAEGVELPNEQRRTRDIALPRYQTDKPDRLEVLARTGSMMFNQRGIDGVSLDDIALRLDITKGGIYHYFDSKNAFIDHCYERAFDIYEATMDVAEQETSGLAATKTGIELNIDAQLSDLHPMSLTTGFGSFPERTQRKLSKRVKDLAERSVRLGHRGIADGTLRPFDVEPVKLVSRGSYTYLAKWLPDGDDAWHAEISAEVSRFLLLGLRART